MPAVGFVYPNGDKVTFDDVKKGNVDIVKMGMSLPTLKCRKKETLIESRQQLSF
jgi:hypothetical protein